MNCLVWGARVRTCEQKKLPWIPNFRQVGHCRDAGFEQPVVEQDCSASTIADESAMTSDDDEADSIWYPPTYC